MNEREYKSIKPLMKDDTEQLTLEMARLRRSGLTLDQIGEKYGMTKQAVAFRFKKMGIKPHRPKPETLIDKIRLKKLYLEDKLPLNKIAAELEVNHLIINAALKLYKVPKRRSSAKSGKYQDFLDKLEVGEKEKIVITGRSPHVRMYAAAKLNGRKISIRNIGENEFEITRLK